MANRSQRRNNVVAGLFVSIAIVLGTFTIIVLSGINFGTTRLVRVAFPIERGAAGLQPGSAVTLGGLLVGKVKSLEIEIDPATGAATQLMADVRVQSSLTLYTDAKVDLVIPLLGGTSSLNIASIGVGPGELAESDVVEATIALPNFLAQAGYGPDQADQVRAIIETIYELTDQVSDFTSTASPEIQEQIEALGRIVAQAEEVTQDLRDVYPEWRDSVSNTLGNAESASDRFGNVTTNVENSTRDAGLLINESRDMIAQNRPGIDAIVANAESATEKLDRETIEVLNETLRDASADLDQMMAWMRESWPGVRKIVANLRLASDQLKLTMVEVRRSPWRLLYQPVKKELENELLYSSARTYADAVGDLRAASEALEALQAAASADPAEGIEPEQIREISAQLADAFERYHKAEADFLTRLIEEQQSPK
jgi:ABC-type transporter Mla subunit MlaD